MHELREMFREGLGLIVDGFQKGFQKLSATGKAAINFVAFLIMAGAAFACLGRKLGLIPDGLLLLFGAFVVAICGAFLYMQKNKLAKFFFIGASATVVTLVLQCYAPGLFHWGQATTKSVDESAEAQAALSETPQRRTCAPPFFVGQEGKPRYWHPPSVRPITDCYLCPFCDTKKKGFDPNTHEKLQPLLEDGVADMRLEKERAEKVALAQQPPPQVQQAQVTAAPTAEPIQEVVAQATAAPTALPAQSEPTASVASHYHQPSAVNVNLWGVPAPRYITPFGRYHQRRPSSPFIKKRDNDKK